MAEMRAVMRHGRKYGYVLQNGVSNNGPPNCVAGSENVPPINGLTDRVRFAIPLCGRADVPDCIADRRDDVVKRKGYRLVGRVDKLPDD